MNLSQLGKLQKIKGCIDRFKANHPKFPLFLNAVAKDALMEGSVVEINVTTPEGKHYCSNIKINAEDLELVDCLKSLTGEN